MSLRTWGKLIIVIGLLLPVGAAAAQGCGRDVLNPCGVIPWPLPSIKSISSPTPYQLRPTPTPQPYTNTPSPTPTATNTPPFVITPTIIAHDDLYDSAGSVVGQANDMIDEFDFDATINLGGDAAPVATTAAGLAAYSTRFFSYVKGLTLFNFSGTGGVLTWVILALGFVLLVVVTINLIPIVSGIFKVVMRLLELIAQFIPF